MDITPRPVVGDAWGRALIAHLDEGGAAGMHLVERDDGYVQADSASLYFADVGELFRVEESTLGRIRGRVLDIGAGGGRFAVAAETAGHDVVALDVSEGCLEACRRQGVSRTFHGTIFELAELQPEPFETFLLMGHNLALLSGPEQAPRFFDTLRTMAAPGAKIVGTNRDPLATDDPRNLEYHQRNRDRGRQPGQIVIRIRWGYLATPWFDYWFLPLDELEAVAAAAGWKLVDQAFGEGGNYLAELVMLD